MLPSSRILLFRATMIAALLTSAGPAQTSQSRPFDPHATMRSVVALLQEDHISHRPVDDAVSQQALATLFDELDPQRLFFLQDDIDGYRPEQDRLDDYARAGDDAFALEVQQLFERRVQAASALALRELERPEDYTVLEALPTDGKAIGFARSREELAERWRLRVKYDRLAMEQGGVAPAEVVSRLERRYGHMGDERDTAVLATSRFLDAITASYDPHTVYLSPRTAADFAVMIKLNYEGIGAVLGMEDGRVVVRKLFDGGSAGSSHAVAVGDVVLAVGDDRGGAMEPVDGLPLDDVVDRIRGPSGTFVRLELAADGAAPRTVRLERRHTELSDSYASGRIVPTGNDRIGWIDLPGFYADPDSGRSATTDVARLLDGFRRDGVTGVVLDLRANGGGLLSEAVSLTGLFLAGGNVVRVQDAAGDTQRFDDPDPGQAWSGPLVVLISRFSASASEILAGAIQDDGRGLVVGDSTTHGKGTVQAVLDLAQYPVARGEHPGGSLKVTTQQFFRPGGDSTQLHGVAADIVVPAWSEVAAEGEAALPHALGFRRIASLVGGGGARREAALVQRLAATSQRRVAEDPDFQAVVQTNRERQRLQAAKAIPLERGAYAAYRRSMRALPTDDEAAKDPEFYQREVCRITGDYARALGVVARGG